MKILAFIVTSLKSNRYYSILVFNSANIFITFTQNKE